MCQLLGMNCNTPTDICFSFEGFHTRGGLTDVHRDGWGIAFFDITIGAFVAPHEAVREKVKQLIGKDRVLEIYCTAPMEVLRARDQYGMYRMADAGKIVQMPGVSAAFEEPKTPDLVLQTDKLEVEESVNRIIELMRSKGYLTGARKNEI